MKSVILILLLTCSFLSKAQTHAEEHYQFDSIYKTTLGYYNRGLYHKAALYPEYLAENRYVNATTNYFFARVFALSNEFDKTLEHLEKAVKGGITKTQIERMYDLDGFRESNLHIIYEMNYGKWHQEYIDSEEETVLDSVYINQLKEIREWKSDFEVRTWYTQDGDVMYIEDSSVIEPNRKQQDSVFYFTMELVLEKGFPIRKRVGEQFNYFSRRLGYSLPKEFSLENKKWKKIKTMIFIEMEKGNLKPFYYAVLEDNIRSARNQNQLNGTINYFYKDSKDKTNAVVYENPDELNIRRRAVGLCPIQLELWSEARELPESLKGVKFK